MVYKLTYQTTKPKGCAIYASSGTHGYSYSQKNIKALDEETKKKALNITSECIYNLHKELKEVFGYTDFKIRFNINIQKEDETNLQK